MEKVKGLFKGKKLLITAPLTVLIGLFLLPITVLLLIGWLIYSKVRSKKIKFIGLGVIGLLVLFFGSAYVYAIANPTTSKPKIIEQKIESTATPSVEVEQNHISTSPTVSDNQGVKVARVIDGDTVELEDGKRLRYIGMDTPEMSGNNPDCFAREAYEKNKELVEGKDVRLEKDVSETDRYGRLLRYVYIGDVMINEELVKEGYASVYTYPPDVKYKDKFIQAQGEARTNNLGLWSSCKATPTLIPTIKPATTTAPTKIYLAPTTKPVTNSGGSYACDCSKTCTEIISCAEAQYQLNYCGCRQRDNDGDGVACDGAPLHCQN